ncbi:MAG: hypothetical protein RBG1_1C00001G1898 [candidate division Zixibacteria bacterium RBG-1]|nr:MAG: hypothetical protein RBG1_1C00001G1898 [candidate division Zixibacteria bacterium RBG-1]OGC85814.1 MAG: hypothetical protein A2V73_00660 [candidate division Zixibacteria bacterium RBG_19FT_COMBO_42_43]
MASKPKSSGVKGKEKYSLPFGKKNLIWFGIALLVIIVGYILLGSGSITLAPLLLVLGYCVLIPVAILIDGEKKTKETVPAERVTQA